MIDLHSHILPGIDDGASGIDISLRMARLAVADGIRTMACTPHIRPGVYDNTAQSIKDATGKLATALEQAQIPLKLVVGADVHIAPDLPEKLRSGVVPTLNNSRYFLFEPPHHVVPPRIDNLVERLFDAGFTPIITHPERLTWIETHYGIIERLNDCGCRIQVTADSLTGEFGEKALFYAQRLVDEERVDIVASDCHGSKSRPPRLARAHALLAHRVGNAKADDMVFNHPDAILANRILPVIRPTRANGAGRKKSWGEALRRMVGMAAE